jgi:hypothetical protein
VSNYKKAPGWKLLEAFFEEVFSSQWQTISELNIAVVRKLAKILGIETPVYVASELGHFPDDPDERLISITKHFNADTYLAGSGGKNYMNLEKYDNNGIRVVFQEYTHPVYRQLFGGFEPFMSVIDLIFNHGNISLNILRSSVPRHSRVDGHPEMP